MKKTAFVLSSGGALGALQVGAIQALFEADIYPDLLVGSSIGAVNAAYLAVNGMSLDGVKSLAQAWCDCSQSDWLPTNPIHLILATLANYGTTACRDKIKAQFNAYGIDASLRFRDIQKVELLVVSTDLTTGNPVVFGNSHANCDDDLVLDAVMASACLPPWMAPIERNGMLLVDGGVVSPLPVEPAIAYGASEIITLDLGERLEKGSFSRGWRSLLYRVMSTSQVREKELELSLACMKGIDVRQIPLNLPSSSIFSDFRHTPELIAQGYRIARDALRLGHATECLPLVAFEV